MSARTLQRRFGDDELTFQGVVDELREDLARITNETGVIFPRAAVLRGLIGLGIAAITGHATLAPIFIASRVARGVKKGQKLQRAVSLAEGSM
jgi:hypothetical protein